MTLWLNEWSWKFIVEQNFQSIQILEGGMQEPGIMED